MNRQKAAALAAFVVVVALFVVGGTLAIAGESSPVWEVVAFGIWLFAFAVVGLLIAFRRPGNAIAWLCLGFAVAWGCQLASDAVLRYEMVNPGFIPRPDLLAVFADQVWVVGVGLLGFMLLLFPDGRLPSPRWRPVAWLLCITMLLVAAHGLMRPGPFPDWDFENPLGVEWVGRLEVAIYVLLLTLITSLIVCASSLVVRHRRADEVGRRQLKWLAAAGLVSACSYALLFVADNLPWILAWCTIPVAIGFAVFRYRLYDIDRLVSRTITYALVAGLLAATYFGAVMLFSLLLPTESDLAIAASTLLLAVLFNPVRRKMQDLVDRRFDRERFDHIKVVEQFTDDLRNQTDLSQIQESLVDVIGSTLRTTSMSVWVRDPVGPDQA